MAHLKGKTLFITGASRGIGLAIALRAARDGANIVIAAKTAHTHAKLPGTIYSAAEDVEAAGGKALPLVCDIRDDQAVAKAVAKAAEHFGGIDIVINNASAIALLGTEAISMSRFDLMHQVNARGTFLVSKTCLPWLMRAKNPHILVLSPPLNMQEKWFAPHVAYSMAKFGMSMCVLGMAGEFREHGIAVNALWPRTTIATSAVMMLGGKELMLRSRKPEIMADAAHAILCKASREFSGNFCIDDEVIEREGVADLSRYAVNPDLPLAPDFFVEPKGAQ
ncbi:MAG: NAD(P)-dependent oxidoreductase [Gammaproteobacteria bacterium]|nr:NAD(P)-dependent oxidoreductase [Gammaproteobacteria bacterium]MDH5302568.1 NAD(P)-dependent oxidoreductase [Gammaproteobacteria bacterium]MDH5321047.1 NAD(P)-dependent oxidoreductase [Gammaproteobacteria bacterium]